MSNPLILVLGLLWILSVVYNIRLFFGRDAMFGDMVGNDGEPIEFYERVLLILSGPLFIWCIYRSAVRCTKCGRWIADCCCEEKQED